MTVPETPQQFDTHPVGLTDLVYPHIEALGRFGSRIVYHAPELASLTDAGTGLTMFKVASVFVDTNSVLIGCGTPNLATSVYDANKNTWKRLSAFMLYRERSAVTSLDQLQVGVYYELRGLSSEIRHRLLEAMNDHAGLRAPSCAHLNAKMLTSVGFTLGGCGDMTKVILPSQLSTLIWRHGLELNGKPVEIRVVNTSAFEVSDHLVGVWRKELNSPVRMVKKALKRKTTKAAPVIIPLQPTADRISAWTGAPITIAMNRPNRLGHALSLLWGRHPEFRVTIPELRLVDDLQTPLEPFPGQLSRVSQIKKHALFSPPVIALINRIKNNRYERYDNVPLDAAVEMLSPVSQAHDDHMRWNFALILVDAQYELRCSPVKNLDPKSKGSKLRRFSNWVLAKHVVATGYDPRTVFAGEAWVEREANGMLALVVSNNSGTYKPSVEQLEVVASLFRGAGLDVRTSIHA